MVNDMLLLPRKLWIHKRTRVLDVLGFHFGPRAITLPQPGSAVTSLGRHAALSVFRLKAPLTLASNHLQKYLMLSRTALLKTPHAKVASIFTNHNPSPASSARSSQTRLVHLLGGKLLPASIVSTAIWDFNSASTST